MQRPKTLPRATLRTYRVMAGNGFRWGSKFRLIAMDALPSDAGSSATTSTGSYRNYDIIKSNQVITYTNYTTGLGDIKGKLTFAIYNKHIDVTTNDASYTTTDGLNETLRANIWVFARCRSCYAYYT
jgi:hypothetical protein